MSFILKILESSDLHRGELEALPWTQSMIEGRASRGDYLRFLLDLYHVVKHFCPTMAVAVSRCRDEWPQLRSHLYHAMHDEMGHEQMVLNDLAAFAIDPREATGREPPPAVTALVATNYYSCAWDHPACVLGMLYTQEFVASCYAGMVAANMAASLNMDGNQGFSFLMSHASLDQDHVQRLHTLLGTLDDPLVQDKVIAAVDLNFYLLSQWIRQLSDFGIRGTRPEER